ncbi:MAG TPA: amidohydrolase family protein [Xanthobacteraceae bacterium]|nr:amidohydrolase family protein [Xanthobacteraceae bacterium]
MITDIHCHFIPEAYFDLVRRRSEFETRVVSADADAITLTCRGARYGLNRTFFEAGRQISRMDALGIDRTVVSLATPLVNYYVDPVLAAQAAKLCNDGLAELVASNRERFAAWAFLPMQDPAAAAAELRRCVEQHGFIGGHVATNVRGTYLSDDRFLPIFETAADLDVPLFLHPADPPGRDRTGDYELTVVAGYLFDSTINIFRMICSNFLDRHPGLRLVCAHTGAFSLMLRNRMQREVDTNPVLSKSLPRRIGDYLRMFYFDTVCFEPEYLRYAAEVVSPERLLLGSDAPFPLGEPDPVKFVRFALSEERAKLALSENFRRLVGRNG